MCVCVCRRYKNSLYATRVLFITYSLRTMGACTYLYTYIHTYIHNNMPTYINMLLTTYKFDC